MKIFELKTPILTKIKTVVGQAIIDGKIPAGQNRAYPEKYSRSFAMTFMSKRSVPDSIEYEILEYNGNKYNADPGTP